MTIFSFHLYLSSIEDIYSDIFISFLVIRKNNPIFKGLKRNKINLFLTNTLIFQYRKNICNLFSSYVYLIEFSFTKN